MIAGPGRADLPSPPSPPPPARAEVAGGAGSAGGGRSPLLLSRSLPPLSLQVAYKERGVLTGVAWPTDGAMAVAAVADGGAPPPSSCFPLSLGEEDEDETKEMVL